jgi:hypothetical protein
VASSADSGANTMLAERAALAVRRAPTAPDLGLALPPAQRRPGRDRRSVVTGRLWRLGAQRLQHLLVHAGVALQQAQRLLEADACRVERRPIRAQCSICCASERPIASPACSAMS